MVVNYVREREAFYDWLSFNTLSPTAQSLWNALFTIYNQKGWPEGFVKVPDMVIRSYMHVSHDALLDARTQLKNKGLLDFTKGERRASSAAYKLIFFTADSEVCTEKADKAAVNLAGKPADKAAVNLAGKPADTSKLNVNQNLNVNQTKGGRGARVYAGAKLGFLDPDDDEGFEMPRFLGGEAL